MTIGSVHAQSGASGYMPKTSSTQTNSVSFNLLDSTSSSSTQNTQKISQNMSSEELLKMLTQNTIAPISNLSSNDLLSLLQNNSSSDSTNKSANLMNNILSAYSNDSDSDDNKSYSAVM